MKQSCEVSDFESGQAVVQFPAPSASSPLRLGRITCQTRPAERNYDHNAPLAFGLAFDTALVNTILRVARAGEPREQRILTEQRVRIHFSPHNCAQGNFGVALALADKLARWAPRAKLPLLYATGHIDPSDGTILASENFDSELNIIEERGEPGSLFVFPRVNYHHLNGFQRERLERLRNEQRIAWRAIGSLEELAYLWSDSLLHTPGSPQPSTRAQSPARRRRPLDYLREATLAVAGLLAGTALLVLWALPVWVACGAVLRILGRALNEQLPMLATATANQLHQWTHLVMIIIALITALALAGESSLWSAIRRWEQAWQRSWHHGGRSFWYHGSALLLVVCRWLLLGGLFGMVIAALTVRQGSTLSILVDGAQTGALAVAFIMGMLVVWRVAAVAGSLLGGHIKAELRRLLGQ